VDANPLKEDFTSASASFPAINGTPNPSFEADVHTPQISSSIAKAEYSGARLIHVIKGKNEEYGFAVIRRRQSKLSFLFTFECIILFARPQLCKLSQRRALEILYIASLSHKFAL